MIFWKCGDNQIGAKKAFLAFLCLLVVVLYGSSCGGVSWMEVKLPYSGKT